MIPAKEKAQELVSKYVHLAKQSTGANGTIYNSKQCALIAVDEILEYIPKFEYGQGEKTTTYTYDYLQEIKLEIEKL